MKFIIVLWKKKNEINDFGVYPQITSQLTYQLYDIKCKIDPCSDEALNACNDMIRFLLSNEILKMMNLYSRGEWRREKAKLEKETNEINN